MREVEDNVREHLEPLRERARCLIADSRFVIPSLQRMPGMMRPNAAELKRMKARVG